MIQKITRGSRLALIAKFGVPILFFRYHTHFGDTAVSPHAKWLTPIIYLQSQCHQRPYSYIADNLQCHLKRSPALLSAMHYSKSSQWRAEWGQWQNKCISCHNFRITRQYLFILKSFPCTLIVGTMVVPCLWMKFAYFSDSDIWKKNWSSYMRLTRNCLPCQTDQWYFLVNQQGTIPETGFGMSHYA